MIARDKQLHFIAGLIIGLTAIFISWYCAYGLVLIAGVGKEVKDEIVYHGFDVYDLLYTMAGGAVSVAIIEVIKWTS